MKSLRSTPSPADPWLRKRAPTPAIDDEFVADGAALPVPVEIVLAQAPVGSASDAGSSVGAGSVAAAPGGAGSMPQAAAAAPVAPSAWLAAGGLGLAVGVAAQQSRKDDAPDRSAPALLISDSVVAGYATGAVVFNFDFSEVVSGFTLDDIVVSGGAKGQLSGSGAHYTLTVTPANRAVGNVTVAVAADAASDEAGNTSQAARTEQAFDTLPPTLLITSDYVGPTADPITFTFQFSEPVSGFTSDDVGVGSGVKGALTGEGASYRMVVTPQEARDYVWVSVPAGAVIDAARNASTERADADEYYVNVYSVRSGVAAVSGLLDESKPYGATILVDTDRITRLDYSGRPDYNSAGGGTLILAPGEGVSFPRAVATSNDYPGKTWVVGVENELYGRNESLMLARYNGNGSRDTSFGDNGLVTQHFPGQVYEFDQWVLQPDGKALVAGFVGSGYTISRFNPDGSLDTGFAGDGTLTLADPSGSRSASDLALLDDGRMLVLTGPVVTRLNADGSPDASFAGDGTFVFDRVEIAFRDDGTIEVTKSDMEEPRYLVPDGTGAVLVVGGTTHYGPNFQPTVHEFALARILSDGSRDSTFSGDFPVMTEITPYGAYVRDAEPQADGKVLVAGTADFTMPLSLNPSYPRAVVVRYNPDGSLDTSFSGDGKVVFEFSEGANYPEQVFQQSDGKVVVEGWYVDDRVGVSGRAVARFNADGTPDTSFFGDGILSDDLPWLTSPDYHALPGGAFFLQGSNDVMARFEADSSLDLDFGREPRAVLDKSWLAATPAQAQRVYGFVDGTDHLLLSRLSYEQLTIADGSGSEAGAAVVSANGQYLAVVLGMNAVNLTAADFVVI